MHYWNYLILDVIFDMFLLFFDFLLMLECFHIILKSFFLRLNKSEDYHSQNEIHKEKLT